MPNLPLFQQPWVATILIAATGYFLWDIAGPYGDHRHKQAKERTVADHRREIDALTQDRDDAEFQVIRLGRLMTHLREVVSEKVQRIRRVVGERSDARVSIQQVRDALGPEEHVAILLESLAGLLRMDAAAEGGRYDQNFRIGLYVEESGLLRPRAAFDLATKSHKPFSSHDRYLSRFRLDNSEKPSHAVRCILDGRLIIVEDCASEVGFEFFEEKQKQYLRSLIACPLTNFCPDGISRVRAALLIDTNVAGFFREDDREMIEKLVTEFVVRVDLEYAVKCLTG